MARDLNEAWGWIQRLVERVSRLESGAMLEKSSITKGRMRFIGGLLRIDSGGRVEVDGEMSGIGKFLWDGIVTLTSTFTAKGTTLFEGDTTQKGPFHVEGDQDNTGKLAIKGETTLEDDLNVKSAGKIIIEGSPSIELSQSSGSAMLKFSDGPRVQSNGASLRLDASSGTGAAAVISASSAALVSPNGLRSATVSNTGTVISGQATVSGTVSLFDLVANTTSAAANVVANATTGLLQRVSSASRFKLDQRTLDLPDELLDVTVKDWLDAGEVAVAFALNKIPQPWTEQQWQAFHGLGIRRMPGVIAEEVHAAGGERFITFDADGRIEGVAYDRLAIARTAIAARRIAALENVVADLARQVAELRAAA